MTQKVLTDVLMKYGPAEREGDEVRLGKDAEASVFVSVGDETLTLQRVGAVELHHDYLVISTRRDEHYVMAYEDVRVVRFGPRGKKAGLV